MGLNTSRAFQPGDEEIEVKGSLRFYFSEIYLMGICILLE